MLENKFDVIVAGGGLSGVAAAIAAARENAKVLIIEQYGFLGGMATAGLVNPFMSYSLWTGRWEYDWSKKINQGIFSQIIEQLRDLGGLHDNHQTFNEELLKLVLDRLIKHFNIRVLFHSHVIDAQRENDRISSVTVFNKSGKSQYFAKVFVDATGDADLSAVAECEYNIGRDKDHQCQPMTLCFRLADVDRSKYEGEKNKLEINKVYEKFHKKGLIKNPRENVLMFEHMVKSVVHFNSTRIIGKNPVSAEDLSDAEMEAREQVFELYNFMKEHIPGFENSKMLMSAPKTGVRESRRIIGEYTITEHDLLSATKFDDSIARGTYPVDIHNPSGSGTMLKDIPYGDYYTIPYRALVPKGIDNLIVAGRPISSTHEAHSAYRIMPICTCIGEAAGIAAFLSIANNTTFRDVDYKKLQSLLRKYNALY